MKKVFTKIMSVALVIITVFSSMCVIASAASWPTVSNRTPIKTYTISSGNNTKAYTSSDLEDRKGTIYASDEIWIYQISKQKNGTYYASCSYPLSNGGGRKYAYIPLSAVTSAKSPSNSYTSRANLTTYRRAGSSSTAGSISKGDKVYKLATSGSWTQVLYNIGSANKPSGWRMAWIPTKNYNNYIKPVSASSFPSKPSNLTATKTSGTTVKLTYGAVSGATGYLVYISTNNSNFKPYGKTTKTYANITIKENATYYFRVCAYKANSSGSYTTGNFAYTGAVKFTLYNATAAVNYAKNHAYDGKGLCAEFVADCVAQGGIKIPNKSYYSSSTKSLTNRTLGAYTNPYTCSEAQLKWFKDNGYKVIKNPSFSQISVGDLVWNTGDGDNHVVIITGKRSNGTPLYSAHNRPACDAVLGSACYVVKLT